MQTSKIDPTAGQCREKLNRFLYDHDPTDHIDRLDRLFDTWAVWNDEGDDITERMNIVTSYRELRRLLELLDTLVEPRIIDRTRQ